MQRNRDNYSTRLPLTMRTKQNPSLMVMIAVTVILILCIQLWTATHATHGDCLTSFVPRTASIWQDTTQVVGFTDTKDTESQIPYLLSSGSNTGSIYRHHSPTKIITTAMTGKEANEEKNKCYCELVSIDCLDSIKCLPSTSTSNDEGNEEHCTGSTSRSTASQKLVALGVTTRMLMKEMATYSNEAQSYWWKCPIGKSFQYNAIFVWKKWATNNILPLKFETYNSTLFVDANRYPFCIEQNLTGWNCIFAGYNTVEDVIPDSMEAKALVALSLSSSDSSLDTITPTKSDLMAFHRQYANLQSENARKTRSNTYTANGMVNRNSVGSSSMSPLGYLLAFSHIVRMGFNLRPFLHEIYRKSHRIVSHSKNQHHHRDGSCTQQEPRLRVSLHMRRADSCNHRKQGYETNASVLDSKAQTSMERMCYNTSVYMDGLRRVQNLAGGRPLSVYLSSDSAGSILEEIQTNFKKEYEEMNWHYLNFSLDTFNYVGYIEYGNHDKHGGLGETALLDLWHLSHGQVFVGHLGSRFGKVAWTLATARHNTFIPFRTVDGHSVCCEVDESCSQVKPYIDSMENCLTFAHELTSKKHKDYWNNGSQLRKEDFLERHGILETMENKI